MLNDNMDNFFYYTVLNINYSRYDIFDKILTNTLCTNTRNVDYGDSIDNMCNIVVIDDHISNILNNKDLLCNKSLYEKYNNNIVLIHKTTDDFRIPDEDYDDIVKEVESLSDVNVRVVKNLEELQLVLWGVK